MPVNTISAAVHITPTVIKTFYKHYRRKASKYADGKKDEEATDDVLYDEAFNIVKSFIELGTHNTVESLQAFTNTHIVSPPWAAVSPVLIPFKTCNKAADMLVEWFFDLDELRRIVGGEKWWQVRGLDGVEGEWVTEKRFLNDTNTMERVKKKEEELGRSLNDDEVDIMRMDCLERVMFYIHGGAFFWGSINTHRYQILKYARKIEGRVFAVNYRKAPQYPWPCPLQDCLAAYLYLTEPPPTALHSAVSPEKIVIAGDSAGGGLCLSLLTVLRDLGKPLPAGGVLISPWVDLTHSFPSVMENTATDIIPPHGFIHKPSMHWPVDALPRNHDRIIPSESPPPPKPGHADTLLPNANRVAKEALDEDRSNSNIAQKDMLNYDGDAREINESTRTLPEQPDEKEARSWYPKPPKVLMEDPNAVPLELRSQIQLYATNEQLTHPLVSPILQGSLGNLCPLYVITGNNECLRDEIIYLAHRAAYPEEFPPRMEAVKESRRQSDNVEKFKTPTKVHLQVFDGMCHVLTVFTFRPAVKYAYRSIAEFVRHVTDNATSSSPDATFPELRRDNPGLKEGGDTHNTERSLPVPSYISNGLKSLSSPFGTSRKSSSSMLETNKAATKEQIQEHPSLNRLDSSESTKDSSTRERIPDDFPRVVMIRQRVDIHGHVRQMEDKKDISCLKLSANEIGVLREAPARRWLAGQKEWDERFKDVAKKVEKRRKKTKEQYENTLKRARELGLVHAPVPDSASTTTDGSVEQDSGDGRIQKSRRWGPLDLDDEDAPPSAIAARRDTPEALALLKKTLYHTAPRTIKKMPKRKVKDVIKAALDPADDPSAPPRQSVSEQQYSAEVVPIHGLSLWAFIMTYFTKRSSAQAVKGKRKTMSGLRKFKVGFTKHGTRSRSDSMRVERKPSAEDHSTN
ncbi:lipase/esterase [Fomitiporia mediterranea MF3/22]|uniref:lipase/esterase n=1 Tax=Fomitiporia mediterranea (strain MF3/22) TaxID=694068 RepID=UPI00044099D6|nr:lipase/esterase [Fomitiporia mediterranea MF3/22]EJD01135.1 lipase/esterase [Fomitiporia mediterranea MF3/22]